MTRSRWCNFCLFSWCSLVVVVEDLGAGVATVGIFSCVFILFDLLSLSQSVAVLGAWYCVVCVCCLWCRPLISKLNLLFVGIVEVC